MTPIVLASSSAARAGLLRGAGVTFAVIPPLVDEQEVKSQMQARGSGPREVAEALASMKAIAVSAISPGLVIGADQTLDLDGLSLDKARTIAEARQTLKRLKGRAHTLHSAVTLAVDGDRLWSETHTAKLTMRDFSDDFLDAYMADAGDAVLRGCGGYLLEGQGAQLFDSIEGDFFTVLGLPLLALLGALRRAGGLTT